jgi:hypothetical protein
VWKCWLFVLALFSLPAAAETQPPSSGKLLVCDFKRLVLFAGNSDYPNGPAYFGVVAGRESSQETRNDTSDLETELQKTVDDSVTRAQGAQFTLDMETGKITPIPFGSNQLLAMEEIPGKGYYSRVYAKLLSRRYNSDPGAAYSVGYFDVEINRLTAVIMIGPETGGVRIFKFISDGDATFGYCHEG